ncbi:hypothetical protein PFISCL1PPCAC_6862 [Pristionchus fissidentatus]|uniref:Ribosomal protein n=1 Tax=Pristionchus fissidentatus TaxID=1538716 RepID=A0AAV5VAI4_9BILA|nr:hypothetical protein PFISCL1PPCAC_6862 [Pristionchus fissidentatus]
MKSSKQLSSELSSLQLSSIAGCGSRQLLLALSTSGSRLGRRVTCVVTGCSCCRRAAHRKRLWRVSLGFGSNGRSTLVALSFSRQSLHCSHSRGRGCVRILHDHLRILAHARSGSARRSLLSVGSLRSFGTRRAGLTGWSGPSLLSGSTRVPVLALGSGVTGRSPRSGLSNISRRARDNARFGRATCNGTIGSLSGIRSGITTVPVTYPCLRRVHEVRAFLRFREVRARRVLQRLRPCLPCRVLQGLRCLREIQDGQGDHEDPGDRVGMEGVRTLAQECTRRWAWYRVVRGLRRVRANHAYQADRCLPKDHARQRCSTLDTPGTGVRR